MKLTEKNFIKLNKKRLTVKTNSKGMFFTLKNRRYYLNDFIRIHCNPWLKDIYPDKIMAVNTDYYKPLFIEIIDTFDTYVNCYERLEA